MDPRALPKLRELVSQHGRSFCNDPHGCEQLLREAMPQMRREVNVLLSAVRQAVAGEMVEYDDERTVLLLMAPLAARLVDKLALTPSAAAWAVETWAIALRVVSRTALAAHRRDRGVDGDKKPRRRVLVRAVLLLTLAAVLLYASSKWFRQVGLEREKPPTPRVFAPARSVVGHVRTFALGGSPLECLAVLPDGERALTGQADGELRMWHVSTGRRLGELSVGRGRRIVCLAPSRDGRRALVAASGPGNDIAVVDLQRFEIVQHLRGQGGEVTCLAFAPDHRRAVSGSADGGICIWDVDAARLVKRLGGRGGRLARLAVSPDGQRVLSAGDDHTVRLWDLQAARPIAEVTVPAGPPPAVAFGRLGPTVMAVEKVSRAHHRVHVWALKGGEFRKACRFYTRDTCAIAAGMGFSPEGDLAVFCEAQGRVHLWDISAAREVARFVARARMAAFLPGRRWGILAADEAFLRLWRLPADRAKLCLQAASERIEAVAFARDGKTLFAWGPRGAVIEAWALPAGGVAIVSRRQMNPFVNQTTSPQGRRLLPCEDGSVRVVDDARDTEIVRLEGHRGRVGCAVFSADFRYALSGGQDATVRLWDLKTLQPLVRLEGHDGPVTCVALSLDARLAASGGADGTVRVWSLPVGPASPPGPVGPVGWVKSRFIATMTHLPPAACAEPEGGSSCRCMHRHLTQPTIAGRFTRKGGQ